MIPSVASLFQSIELAQPIRPLLIGERCNANGSKAFRELLLAEDYEGCLRLAIAQEQSGAHVLDLCTAYAGRDEGRDLAALVPLFARNLRAGLMLDSTTPACIEACLPLYPGRCLVNSINLEDGGANLRRICRAVKRWGAAVVALTINERGMAMTADDKVETAKAIYRIATGEFGLRPQDLLFDCLTFTVGAGDETLRDAAVQTLNAIRRIKAELPGVYTVLGVSNISFGLAAPARRILNSVFLHEAVEAGLDAAIVDAAKILPLNRISEADREVCLDLLYDRSKAGQDRPVMRFIEHFSTQAPAADDISEATERRLEPELFRHVVDGDASDLVDILEALLQRYRATDIINQILVPAMRHVGELFGRGEILLPFVLKSAEVMKASVVILEPHMDRVEGRGGPSILLATVQGDVHDIGKNLVDIILSNNGYRVHNLGIKVPAETIIQKARELQVDLIGLSGLLVKSAIVMQENLPQFAAAGLRQPVLLGGAALTPKFVAEACVPHYPAPVVYCADAFAGLKAMKDFEAGTLASTQYTPAGEGPRAVPGLKDIAVTHDHAVPEAPFLGCRHVTGIDPALFLPLVNRQALFRGRWGYRRGKLSAAEYDDLITREVEPIFARLAEASCRGGLIEAGVAYGYFRGWSEGDEVVIDDNGTLVRLGFPRQSAPPHLCIADFFRPAAAGGDVVAFLVVTIGPKISLETQRLYAENHYHDYLMLHGFSVEMADALTEYWHAVMRRELGIAVDEPDSMDGFVTQGYRGARYGFGYPSCPDLGAHREVFQLLHPEAIGITLSETMQMVPEQSTSAIVAHHPQAKYFAV